jgi:hypothetical protein
MGEGMSQLPPPPPPPPLAARPSALPPGNKTPWWKPRRSWKWWTVTGVATLVVLIVIGALAPPPPKKAVSAVTPNQPTSTPSISPTSSPSIAAHTAVPTARPTAAPTSDPHALTGANVTKSILNNENDPNIPNTDFTGLKVQIEAGGQVVVTADPTNVLDEQNFITTAALDSLEVIQSVKGWYPGITIIHMQLESAFTDQYGHTTTEDGTWLEFTSATFDMINPSGLSANTFSQPTDLYAIADAYFIHPAVWKNINQQHRGQLVTSDGGPALIHAVPT